jgi:hypothetical protein
MQKCARTIGKEQDISQDKRVLIEAGVRSKESEELTAIRGQGKHIRAGGLMMPPHPDDMVFSDGEILCQEIPFLAM